MIQVCVVETDVSGDEVCCFSFPVLLLLRLKLSSSLRIPQSNSDGDRYLGLARVPLAPLARNENIQGTKDHTYHHKLTKFQANLS
jgi:hypothetical protein